MDCDRLVWRSLGLLSVFCRWHGRGKKKAVGGQGCLAVLKSVGNKFSRNRKTMSLVTELYNLRAWSEVRQVPAWLGSVTTLCPAASRLLCWPRMKKRSSFAVWQGHWYPYSGSGRRPFQGRKRAATVGVRGLQQRENFWRLVANQAGNVHWGWKGSEGGCYESAKLNGTGDRRTDYRQWYSGIKEDGLGFQRKERNVMLERWGVGGGQMCRLYPSEFWH